MRQQVSVIAVIICRSVHSLLQTHTIRIIGICDSCSGLRLAGQLSAVLPAIVPGSIVFYISDGIAGNRLPVILGQKIPPLTVTIFISDRLLRSSRRSCRIGILGLRQNISTCIIGILLGFSCRLIVFPCQLLKAIILIHRALPADSHHSNVPATVISVIKLPGSAGTGLILPADHPRRYIIRSWNFMIQCRLQYLLFPKQRPDFIN